MIGGLVYGYLAFMILPVYAALDRMDPALIEAGKDLYGSDWSTFWHVTWPTTFQGVLAGTVLVFLPAVGDFVSAQLLGGPGTYMIGNLIQQQFFGAENWPFGAALTDAADAVPVRVDGALPALRGAGGAGGDGMRWLRALRRDLLRLPVRADRCSWSCSRSTRSARCSASTASASSGTGAFFENESLRGSLVASLEIAFVTMMVGTVLGTLLAFGLVRSRSRFASSANILMLVPLVTPEIVAGVSAFLLFTQLGVRLSLLTITLAHITFSISYVTVVVRARLASLHPEVEQAAMDLGATRMQTLRLVVLPALWPAVVAAGLLVFALSFDDFVLSFFTTGESPQPLPVRIWSAIRFGVTPTINAIGTLMLAISTVAIALAIALPRLFGRRESGLGVLLGREAA